MRNDMMAEPIPPDGGLIPRPARTLSRETTVKEGYLVKKGHIRHNWRTRWFVLKRHSLSYFKHREDSNPKGQITLAGAAIDCPPSILDSRTKRPWLLKLTTVEGKEYLIEAPDQITRSEWHLAIEERIRKLDPSKLEERKRVSTIERSSITLRRSFHSAQNETEISQQRDIVQAMQDLSAGVKLYEIKRGRHVDKCFTGKDAIDWIIAWFFAPDRPTANELTSTMLRNGFFHAIEEGGVGKFLTSTIAADKGKFYEFHDSESARYIFVSFAPVQSVDLFSISDEEEEECVNASDSSPELSRLSKMNRPMSMDSIDSVPEENDDEIIRQGFLLKKGHVRRTWKIRRFVLKKKSTHLCYYKTNTIKSRPQGGIELMGCVVTILDREPPSSSNSSDSGSPSPKAKTKSLPLKLRETTPRPYLFCLETLTGVKYYIQAASDEERNDWITDIRLHIQNLTLTSTNST